MVDDLGRGDVGFLGGSLATPSIDRIAREGVSLDGFYAEPVCSLTRAALLTGRSPAELGLLSVIRPWETRGLDPRARTLADVLGAAGYATALVGKWHLGHARRSQWPRARGFDHFYGSLGGSIDYFSHRRDGTLDWQRNGDSVDEDGYATDLVADEAVRWLASLPATQPFFLQVAFHAPHPPRQAPRARLRAHAGLPGPERRYAAMVDALDEGIGRVLDALDHTGRTGDTLVVFLSDNGAGDPDRTAGLRGSKGSTYEGGLRVPAAMRFPSRLQANTSSAQRLRGADLFATALDALGLAVPAGIDGASVWPELAGGSAREMPAFLFAADSRHERSRAILDGRWKRVERFDPRAERWRGELFDVVADPREAVDVSAREAAVAERLAAQLAHWYEVELGAPARLEAEPPPGWEPPADRARAAAP